MKRTGVKCNECGSIKSKVVDSRRDEEGNLRRRRQCACGSKYTTMEISLDELGPESKYPFHTMRIGDNFPLDVTKLNSISSLAYKIGKRYGMVFTFKKVDGGYKCYRIE